MEYLATEKTLGAPATVRHFSLDSLGLNQAATLAHLRSLSVLLEWDEYDEKLRRLQFLMQKFPEAKPALQAFMPAYYAGEVGPSELLNYIAMLGEADRFTFEQIRPRRKRSIAKMRLSRMLDGWSILRLPAPEYRQNVGTGDVRATVRKFKEMSPLITKNPLMQAFIMKVAEMVAEVRPDATQLEMTHHRMYAVGDVMAPGDNAPEGAHQDGADFIVSAMVISRHDVIGAESIVCNEAGDEVYLQHPLQAGEGIFQADTGSPLWHDVTPIQYDPSTPTLDGFRDIIGLDINLLS